MSEPPEPLSDCQTADGDGFALEAAVLDDDDLVATLSYGGGCETHDFVLCWPDQTFMESLPVQVALEIWHDGHDDMCDAYITEDVTFDLAPLKDAYTDAYGGGGTIVINLDGESLEYNF